jgi:hypothetical protein
VIQIQESTNHYASGTANDSKEITTKTNQFQTSTSTSKKTVQLR